MRGGKPLAAGPTDAVMTGENLSAVYDTPIEVYRIVDRLVVLPPISR